MKKSKSLSRKNEKQTKKRKTSLFSPEKCLRIAPGALLHVVPDDEGVSVNSEDHVDGVGYAVVKLAHKLWTANLLCPLVASVATNETKCND